MKSCKGPIEIGKTYLDQWGRSHHIYGYVKDSKTSVYSLSDHFSLKTGVGTSGTTLVILPPNEEREFWKARIQLIRESNPPDKLSLIKKELSAMQDRLDELGPKGVKQ